MKRSVILIPLIVILIFSAYLLIGKLREKRVPNVTGALVKKIPLKTGTYKDILVNISGTFRELKMENISGNVDLFNYEIQVEGIKVKGTKASLYKYEGNLSKGRVEKVVIGSSGIFGKSIKVEKYSSIKISGKCEIITLTLNGYISTSLGSSFVRNWNLEIENFSGTIEISGKSIRIVGNAKKISFSI